VNLQIEKTEAEKALENEPEKKADDYDKKGKKM
jgi:hypothetical protein